MVVTPLTRARKRRRTYLTAGRLKLLLDAGTSVSEIAHQTKCHIRTVYRAIETLGLKDYLVPRHDLTKDTLENLYPKHTEREIAGELGCSVTTVHRALVKHGIARERRTARGERSARSKHTEAMVRLVRDSAANKMPIKQIAALTGIPVQTIYKIVQRKTWKHVL